MSGVRMFLALGLFSLGLSIFLWLMVSGYRLATAPGKTLMAPFRVTGGDIDDPDKLGSALAVLFQAKLEAVKQQVEACQAMLTGESVETISEREVYKPTPVRIPEQIFESFDVDVALAGIDVGPLVNQLREFVFRPSMLRVALHYDEEKAVAAIDGRAMDLGSLLVPTSVQTECILKDLAFTIVKAQQTKAIPEFASLSTDSLSTIVAGLSTLASLNARSKPATVDEYKSVLASLESIADRPKRWSRLSEIMAKIAERAESPRTAIDYYKEAVAGLPKDSDGDASRERIRHIIDELKTQITESEPENIANAIAAVVAAPANDDGSSFAQMARESVYQVVAEDESIAVSGFAVDKTGLVMTALLPREGMKVRLKSARQGRSTGVVIAVDSKSKLSLVKTDPLPNILELETDIRLQRQLLVLGFTAPQGVVASVRGVVEAAGDTELRYSRASTAKLPGLAGAPLLGESGRAIGVHLGGSVERVEDNVSAARHLESGWEPATAVPAKLAIAFLERVRSAVPSTPFQPKGPAPEESEDQAPADVPVSDRTAAGYQHRAARFSGPKFVAYFRKLMADEFEQQPGTETLEQLAQGISGKTENCAIEVRGYSDIDGDKTANYLLSWRRAATIGERLISLGIAAERLRIVARGQLGAQRSAKDNDRRVEAFVRCYGASPAGV